MIVIAYLLAGLSAGLIAGLFGVGGGIVVVPVLVWVFESQGFGNDYLVHLAVGTSLATIVFTSISSVVGHHKQSAVRWDLWRTMGLGVFVGAVFGVLAVTQISGESLKILIGIFAILLAIKLFLARDRRGERELPSSRILMGAGAAIASLSTIFGIGGGSLSTPYLSRYKLSMHHVVGTAAALGFPIALVGALTNVLVGLGWFGELDVTLPEWSLGFVYLPALLGIVICSVPGAKLGAALAHKLPEKTLKLSFAIFLLMVGLKFLI